LIGRRSLLTGGLAGLTASAALAARAQDAASPAAVPEEAPGPRDDPEDAYPDFLLSPVPLTPPPPGPRYLKFHHLHTGENLEAVYWEDGRYVWDAMAAISAHLRDFRSLEIHPIDVRLLDILFTLRSLTGSKEPYRIVSAFRSPETNQMLSGQSAATNGVTQVAKKSLHMEGKAMDVRLNDVSLTGFRDAALALQGGGVGYYADSAFVHVDIGPVRTWQGT